MGNYDAGWSGVYERGDAWDMGCWRGADGLPAGRAGNTWWKAVGDGGGVMAIYKFDGSRLRVRQLAGIPLPSGVIIGTKDGVFVRFSMAAVVGDVHPYA